MIVVPPIGGPERVVAELPGSVRQFSWLPNSKAVIVSGLAVVSIDDGEIKPLHTAPENTSDLKPAVAPNGRAVAFARGNNVAASVYIAGLDGAGNLTEAPRRLTTSTDTVHGIAWTADSAAVVVDSGPSVAPANLWRIGVAPASPPKELPFGRGGGRRTDPAAWDGSTVAIARTGNRLVYCRGVQNVNLWRLPLAVPATPAGMPAKFLPSTRVEINPAYSPDGKRVVFHSTRSGKPGLWVGDASGANAADLFVPQRGHAGSPSWSPDGQTIVFDWNDTGRYQIYAVRAAGGKPHRLTNDPASDTIPNWSADGKWIYFTSTRSGRPEIWKIPASGGAAVQVTRNGGTLPRESPDGRFVYYLKNGGSGGIWRTPVTGQGNDEIQIVPSIYRRHFALSARGIYFVSVAGEDGKHALSHVPFEGGKPKAILTLPRIPVMGLAVSPDGGSLLYSQVEQISQELALVDNFK
jgi:Tol biopolymer transport system component